MGSFDIILYGHLTIPTGENILLHHYERFTKRYGECLLDDISSREGTPFVVLRVRTVTPTITSFDNMMD